MQFRRKKGSFLLVIILGLPLFLTSCQFFKKKLETSPEPPKIWKVEKDVPDTPYYDGICAKADEYIVLKYP